MNQIICCYYQIFIIIKLIEIKIKNSNGIINFKNVFSNKKLTVSI